MDAACQRHPHEPSELPDAYGATDPSEYFAAPTEVFFEKAQALAAEEPAVYRELAGLYRLHPAEWSAATQTG